MSEMDCFTLAMIALFEMIVFILACLEYCVINMESQFSGLEAL